MPVCHLPTGGSDCSRCFGSGDNEKVRRSGLVDHCPSVIAAAANTHLPPRLVRFQRPNFAFRLLRFESHNLAFGVYDARNRLFLLLPGGDGWGAAGPGVCIWSRKMVRHNLPHFADPNLDHGGEPRRPEVSSQPGGLLALFSGWGLGGDQRSCGAVPSGPIIPSFTEGTNVLP